MSELNLIKFTKWQAASVTAWELRAFAAFLRFISWLADCCDLGRYEFQRYQGQLEWYETVWGR